MPQAAAQLAPPPRVVTHRLLFIDNLRWLMIVLVVAMHAAVTYSGLGSWYYIERSELGTATLACFAFCQSHVQAFFMGLLFFIAGYFVCEACRRKGPQRFMADRAVRLGLPTAIYAVLIHPAIVYYLLLPASGAPLPSPAAVWHDYLWNLRFLSGTGPMWFALSLLIFSVAYGLWQMTGKCRWRQQEDRPLPTHASTILLVAVIALCTFLVRIVQPMGTAILNMQLCYFSQYVILFALGIVAYRQNWLTRIPVEFGRRWLAIAIIAGPLLWLATIATTGTDKRAIAQLSGGPNWHSAAFCFWESLACVGMCIGLLVLFRERFNRQGWLARFMSANSFAVYVLHPPILIALALAMRKLALPAAPKFAMLAAGGIVASFLLCEVVRRIPGLRRILR